MNEADARFIALAIAPVDGGCAYCVAEALAPLTKRWPQFDWAALAAEHRLFNGELDHLRELIAEHAE